jgi:hypothetical protein
MADDVSATQTGETHNQLWLISYPAGRVKRITNDLHDYSPSGFGVSVDDTIATRAIRGRRIPSGRLESSVS